MTALQNFIAKHTATETPTRLYCPEHGDFDGVIRTFHGVETPSACPVCHAQRRAEVEAERQRQEETAERQRWEQRLRNAGIPRRFWERSFEHYATASPEQQRVLKLAQSYAARFQKVRDKGTCLIFSGGPGTGKTHLACSILHHLLAAGYQAEFSGAYSLLRRIKSTWRPSSDESEHAVIRHYTDLDLLVLDEVGIQFGSETEKLLLFEILNGRYEAVLPTLLISNLPAPELETYLGARVMDRLRENGGTLATFDWDSARGSQA